MILAVLQARMSSTRLPGKVLADIAGRPMLDREIERILRAQRVDKLIVATSEDSSDDPIVRLCLELGVPAYRGSPGDVLDRYYRAVKPLDPAHVVRVTGDCPLIDPVVIDKAVEVHLLENNDYTSNTLYPTYPDGLDVEVVRFSALETAWREARLSSEREHVTPFLKNSDQFQIGHVCALTDHSNLRWTVDEPEDLELIRIIFSVLYADKPNFTSEDIYDLLNDRPELAVVNGMHKRDSRYYSLLQLEARESDT